MPNPAKGQVSRFCSIVFLQGYYVVGFFFTKEREREREGGFFDPFTYGQWGGEGGLGTGSGIHVSCSTEVSHHPLLQPLFFVDLIHLALNPYFRLKWFRARVAILRDLGSGGNVSSL